MAKTVLAADALEALPNDKLTAELAKSKDALFNLRFQAVTGQLEANHRCISTTLPIARIYTILRERELVSGLLRLARRSKD